MQCGTALHSKPIDCTVFRAIIPSHSFFLHNGCHSVFRRLQFRVFSRRNNQTAKRADFCREELSLNNKGTMVFPPSPSGPRYIILLVLIRRLWFARLQRNLVVAQ